MQIAQSMNPSGLLAGRAALTDSASPESAPSRNCQRRRLREDPNENELAADAASGSVIPTLTLEVTKLQAQVLEKVTLTNATVVEAEQAGGGSAFAFDYQKMAVSNGRPTATETRGVLRHRHWPRRRSH